MAKNPHKNGNLDRILRLQKRAVSIITHSSFLAHSASLFKALNILTIYDLTHLSQWRIQDFGSEGSNLRNSGQSRQYFVTLQ